MRTKLDKNVKRQIIAVLKNYQSMDLKLEILETKLETVTDERHELKILETISKIERDRDVIDAALNTLQDRHRKFFDLYKLDLYSMTEIGQILNIDRSVCYTRLDDICFEIYNQLLER